MKLHTSSLRASGDLDSVKLCGEEEVSINGVHQVLRVLRVLREVSSTVRGTYDSVPLRT